MKASEVRSTSVYYNLLQQALLAMRTNATITVNGWAIRKDKTCFTVLQESDWKTYPANQLGVNSTINHVMEW